LSCPLVCSRHLIDIVGFGLCEMVPLFLDDRQV